MAIKVTYETKAIALISALIAAAIITVVVSVVYIAKARDNVKLNYVTHEGVIYSWAHFECIAGVMYKRGDPDMLLVDINKNPLQCENIVMTKKEFDAL